MAVIKKLGDRVEKEHNQFLRDSQRIEDRSATATNGPADGLTPRGGMDFATLVSGAGAATIKADTELNGDWEDDVWGSILSSGPPEVRNPPTLRWKNRRSLIHLWNGIYSRAPRSRKSVMSLQFLPHCNRHRAFRRPHTSARPSAPNYRGRRQRQRRLLRESTREAEPAG